MRFVGGKARIAKRLVAAMRAEVGDAPCWEPFCGGASMTVELARTGKPGRASDAHAPLIALYRAVQAGWSPPGRVSRATWHAAQRLPDSDPLKAFCGYAVSWGGIWFRHFDGMTTRGGVLRSGKSYRLTANPARAAKRGLARLATAANSWRFECASFFDVKPKRFAGFIYADPPYAGRAYEYPVDFDFDAFWPRCQQWAKYAPVFVSEYECPVKHVLIAEIARPLKINRSATHDEDGRVERLFMVLP